MLKNPILLLILCLSLNQVAAQETKPSYINVFIAADKGIYVETEKTAFEDIKTKISEIVSNMPFQVDQRVVYRIFADEELKHGYIMDVNREMLSGFDERGHPKIPFEHPGAGNRWEQLVPVGRFGTA